MSMGNLIIFFVLFYILFVKSVVDTLATPLCSLCRTQLNSKLNLKLNFDLKGISERMKTTLSSVRYVGSEENPLSEANEKHKNSMEGKTYLKL